MPAHKRKPNYKPTSTMQELLTAVCDYYGILLTIGSQKTQITLAYTT